MPKCISFYSNAMYDHGYYRLVNESIISMVRRSLKCMFYCTH